MGVKKRIPGQRDKRARFMGTSRRSGVTEYRGIWVTTEKRGWKGDFHKIPVFNGPWQGIRFKHRVSEI